MSKSKKIGLIVGTVVVAAIGGTYLIVRSLGGKELTPLDAAKIMPEDTIAAAYINTNSETWSKLNQFGTSEAQKLIGGQMEEGQEAIEKAAQEDPALKDINYTEDIQPWLGNIMLAALPSEKETPKVLGVIGIKDKLAAARFFDKLKNKAEDGLTKSEYQGITIIENKDQEQGLLNTIAILDDKIVLSLDKETIQKAIDTYQGAASFANKEGARELLTQASQQDNTLFQVYVPDYNGLMRQYVRYAQQNSAGIDSAALKSLESQLDRYNYVDSVILSVGIEDNRGILMRGITKYNSNARELLEFYPEIPGKVLSQIPGNSLMLISSGGIAQTWSWLAEEFSTDPEFKQALDEARESVRSATNLDLDRDILGWMDGEVAISVIPSDNTPAMVSGTVVITTTDRATAENTIARLETLAQTQGNLPISKTEVDGKEVTEYRDFPGGTVYIAHTWLDDNSFALTLGEGADKIVELNSQDSLAENQYFKEITRDFPKQNLGYFYVNFNEVNALVDRLSQAYGQPVPPEVKSFLNSVKGVAGVSLLTDSTTYRSDVLIELATDNKN